VLNSEPNRWDHDAASSAGIRPGQLWLIEVSSAADPPASVRQALAEANVVIYDRALGPLVAGLLPLGGYAEPAAEGQLDAAAERCAHFARDGWSVVRLAAGGQDRQTIVIDAPVSAVAPHLHAVAANGLAG
jgi:hypothetical protein